MTGDQPPDTDGGFFDNLNPFAGVAESITTAVLVGLGVALAGAGLALMIKDTALAKNAVSAVKLAATKGVVK